MAEQLRYLVPNESDDRVAAFLAKCVYDGEGA